jgi:hypothetical protein
MTANGGKHIYGLSRQSRLDLSLGDLKIAASASQSI